MTTGERLKAIRVRAEAATEGPWSHEWYYFTYYVNDGSSQDWFAPPWIPEGKCGGCGHENGELVRVYADEKGATCHLHRVPSTDWHDISNADGATIVGNYDYEAGGVATTEADSDFIAHARQDIPFLLEELRATKQDLDHARAERNRIGLETRRELMREIDRLKAELAAGKGEA